MLTTADLSFFSVLASAETMADAARRMDVTAPAVTQRLKQLEQRLGVKLIDRTSRQLHLTAEGTHLAEQALRLLTEIELVTESLVAARHEPTGHLRVVAPFGFGRRYIAPVCAALTQRYLQLKCSLQLVDNPLRLRASTWDVLVHIGDLKDSSMTMHKLAPNRRILCASPLYANSMGPLSEPSDLRHHPCAVVRENDEDVSLWRFTREGGEAQAVRVEPQLSSNDGEVVKRWAMDGAAIIVRSQWDVADALETGDLVELLPDWQLPSADVVALTGARSSRTARVHAFLEHLRAALRPLPWQMGVGTGSST